MITVTIVTLNVHLKLLCVDIIVNYYSLTSDVCVNMDGPSMTAQPVNSLITTTPPNYFE